MALHTVFVVVLLVGVLRIALSAFHFTRRLRLYRRVFRCALALGATREQAGARAASIVGRDLAWDEADRGPTRWSPLEEQKELERERQRKAQRARARTAAEAKRKAAEAKARVARDEYNGEAEVRFAKVLERARIHAENEERERESSHEAS